jgi:hypothetical protein
MCCRFADHHAIIQTGPWEVFLSNDVISRGPPSWRRLQSPYDTLYILPFWQFASSSVLMDFGIARVLEEQCEGLTTCRKSTGSVRRAS